MSQKDVARDATKARICSECADILTLHNNARIAQETEVRGVLLATGGLTFLVCENLLTVTLYPLPYLCYTPNIKQTTPLPESSPSLNTGTRTAAHFPAHAYEQQDAIFSQ